MKNFKTGKKFTATIAIIVFGGLSVGMTLKSNSKITDGKIGEKSIPQIYPTYNSFKEMVNAKDTKYFEPVRISSSGSKEKPMYHGFFFYNCSQHELLQFDPSGRYMLGLRTFIEAQKIKPTDKGEIGIFDLHKNNKWIKIGETTAWNYQQGCRLQWIPGSPEEIIWNDRSVDGKKLISKIYNTRTKNTRTLPFPVYTISPDGRTALSVNFERILHGGCNYAGIEEPNKKQWAPNDIGIWKMDMNTGKLKMILSVNEMAKIMYPNGLPSDTVGGTLYFFREGFNPSGNRFIAFVKDVRETAPGVTKTRTEGFSMNLDGKDIKYFYREPSHHFWLNDEEIIDNGKHLSPDGTESIGYFRFKDDGTGRAKEKYFDAPNGHISIHKNGDWILTDTYAIDGYFFFYMYHIPTKKFVLLARLKDNAGWLPEVGFSADLHARLSPDGKFVSFDSTYEGLGRQMYMIDISSIIDNPPK